MKEKRKGLFLTMNGDAPRTCGCNALPTSDGDGKDDARARGVASGADEEAGEEPAGLKAPPTSLPEDDIMLSPSRSSFPALSGPLPRLPLGEGVRAPSSPPSFSCPCADSRALLDAKPACPSRTRSSSSACASVHSSRILRISSTKRLSKRPSVATRTTSPALRRERVFRERGDSQGRKERKIGKEGRKEGRE